MFAAIIPIVVAVIGLLAYALSSQAKLAEAGRLAYACGMLVALMVAAHHLVALP